MVYVRKMVHFSIKTVPTQDTLILFSLRKMRMRGGRKKGQGAVT